MPNVKPILPPLKTPKSASFPSELHDGSVSSISSSSIKQEDSDTPITPHSSIQLPKVYAEFLEAFTPVFSPVSAGGTHRFQFEPKNASPTSQPASSLSSSFKFSPSTQSPTISLPPPTPGSAVSSRRGFPFPRRLRIPTSAMYSPTTDSPTSATPLHTPLSAYDWKQRYNEAPRSATGKLVSVKQVITRTVTYKRTQLDAPPKGKRRKCRDTHDTKEVKEPKEPKEPKLIQEPKEV
ncbi:hypothetical protein N7495_006749 [Penicillium taxi]|uniref:uncharacterized protein n=1 Tax=Penicillium taxi TaxID=168475 RepID=UPI002545A2C8|nr:uncharacterized protein N7495_006749 [Penicillium taxi]KAJ5895058.1 hypothetical protein N7495_006749 [Penicillium taxi]